MRRTRRERDIVERCGSKRVRKWTRRHMCITDRSNERCALREEH